MTTAVVAIGPSHTERREQRALETQTAIALLAAAHVRRMINDGWSLSYDQFGALSLVPPAVTCEVHQ